MDSETKDFNHLAHLSAVEEYLRQRQSCQPRNAKAIIKEAETEDETALEVDIMILDYQAYQTTIKVLTSRHNPEGEELASLERELIMIDSFLCVFKERHPDYRADLELRIRLLILQLSTLYTRRLTRNPSTPSLAALRTLRQDHTERAKNWVKKAGRPSANHDVSDFDQELPIAQELLERNRVHVLYCLDIPAEDQQYQDDFYGTSACVSLLDLLPLHMQACAAVAAVDGSQISPVSTNVCNQFMMQASLEQYLVCGRDKVDAIEEAFAWGPTDDVGSEDQEHGSKDVNAMFGHTRSSDAAATWQTLRQRTLTNLFRIESDPTTTLVERLEEHALAYPIDEFDRDLRRELRRLAHAIPSPILSQLEQGSLDGMTGIETREFLKDCGVVL